MSHTPRRPYRPDDPTRRAVLLLAVGVLVAGLVVVAAVLLRSPESLPDDATPSPGVSPSAASSGDPSPSGATAAGEPSASATPDPTPEPPNAEPGPSARRIDVSDPLAPYRITAGGGRGPWAIPVFRAATVNNASGSGPTGFSGRDLRLLVDPQRVRSDGSPEDLLVPALEAALAPPAVRQASNGLPYGAPYQNLWAEGVTLASVERSADGSTLEIDLASGPAGEMLAPSRDELSAQITAYQQLAWTAAAVLGDRRGRVIVSLDGEERPLPATNLGDGLQATPGVLAPVQLLAPLQGSSRRRSVRVIGLVARDAVNPLATLSRSGEDVFDVVRVRIGPPEPLGTRLRLVDAALFLLARPTVVEVSLSALQVSDARVIRIPEKR